MTTFEFEPNVEPGLISEERQTSIGSQVVATWLMQDIAELINPRTNKDFTVEYHNISVVKFIEPLNHAGGFQLVREDLVNFTKPGLNNYKTKLQLGLVSNEEQNKYGPRNCKVNSDFVIATNYLEDPSYKGKLDAQIDLSGLLRTQGANMREHYANQAARNIEASGADVKLVEIIASAAFDSLYYLEN